MSKYAFEAIQIDSDDGTGHVIPYSNTAVGIQNGVFYLISGRPGIDGSKIITGDTTRDLWYEGILDGKHLTCTRQADFVEAGCIASVSNLDFAVNNTGLFFNILDTNGVFISRCKVRYFWVTSDDLTTFNFKQRWQGVVDNQPFDEWTYNIQCVDNDKALFHAVPITTIDAAQFSTVTKDSQGKMIPIMLGRVPYAKALNVSGASTAIPLCRINVNGTATDITVCGAYGNPHGSTTLQVAGYDPSTRQINLFTSGVVFFKDDSRLINSFINIISGGTSQSRKIVANLATVGQITTVEVDEVLDTGTAFVALTALDSSASQSVNAWYFEIKSFSADLVISEKPIYSLNNNEHASRCLFVYDSSVNDYRDISDIQIKTDLTNINKENHPGLSVLAKTIDVNDDVSTYYRVRPKQIKLFYQSGIDPSSTLYPLVGQLVPLLYDIDDATHYTVVAPSANGTMTLYLDILMPDNIINKNWDELYLLLDLSQSAQTTVPTWVHGTVYVANAIIRPTVDNGFFYYASPGGTSGGSEPTWPTGVGSSVVDNDITWFRSTAYPADNDVAGTMILTGMNLYGQLNDAIIASEILVSGIVTSAGASFNFLPGVYFGEFRNDSYFYQRKNETNVAALLTTIKKTQAFNVIRCQIDLTGSFAGGTRIPGFSYTMLLKEIGLVGKRKVNFSTDSIYTSGKGEIFGTTWNGRRTPGNPILLIGDAFEHLARNYDYPYPVWQPNTVYPASQIIRSTADNDHFYIANPGGTSGGSEPTWPTNPGEPVVDNTITWDEFGTFKIDDDSFDTLAAQRANWFIGRSILDKKNTDEYYKELAAQGFFGVQTDSQGWISVKSWLDDTTSKILFYEGNIVRGSLSGINSTPTRRVWNDLLIRYGFNPASGNFDKTIQVTKPDQSVFPGPSDLVNPGTDLGTFLAERGVGVALYNFLITTTSVHGLTSGDLVSLSGNTEGYNFTSLPVSVLGVTQFIVSVSPSTITTATSSASGTLIKNATGTLLWQTFVSGIQNYALAKTLWDDCHASYTRTKVIQKLPSSLGDCYWFIDPAASDPDKNSFFPDVFGAGDEHPAVYLARYFAAWSTRQKDQVPFLVPKDLLLDDGITSILDLKLYECVSFQDQKLTAGDTKTAWVHEITDVPSSGNTPGFLRIGLTIIPDDFPECKFLYDTPGAATTLTDTPGAGTTVTDTPC